MSCRALCWVAFILAGIAAAIGPVGWQVAYAAGAIATAGLAHGVSDLAIVPRHRFSFLVAYLAVGAGVLAWWLVAPGSALLIFLLSSAVHFGMEDAPTDRPLERVCRGTLMIAGPALLHRATLADLFAMLTRQPVFAQLLASTLFAAALVALALLPFVLTSQRRAPLRLVAGTAALVALPPLVGFTIGFVLLHAVPQLCARMSERQCADIGSYLARHVGICACATGVIGATSLLFLDQASPALSILFAALAALATPHMLVTPLWSDRSDVPRELMAARSRTTSATACR